MIMSCKTKYIIEVSFLGLGSLAFIFFLINDYLKYDEVHGWLIFLCSLFLYYFLSNLTWGVREEGQEDDELDTHIKAQSSKATYPFLMISSVVIYYFFSDNDNYPLLAVIALIFVARPLFELIYSRKFK